MTIDATKSPTPVWQRRTIAVLLAVLLAAVGYLVWTKELHHSAPAAAPAPASAPAASRTTPAPRSANPPSIPTTTVPGGIPVSSRDPFGN